VSTITDSLTGFAPVSLGNVPSMIFYDYVVAVIALRRWRRRSLWFMTASVTEDPDVQVQPVEAVPSHGGDVTSMPAQ
jgi:hypothetical protein